MDQTSGSLHIDDWEAKVYTHGDRIGVILIVVAGVLSMLSVTGVFVYIGMTMSKRMREPQFLYTIPLFMSLMFADLLQSAGSVMNTKWVMEGIASPNAYCMFQGLIKQMGNVAIAVWSFMVALHVFCTLFRRGTPTMLGLVMKLVLGWGFVIFIVLLGPLAVHRQEKGPFFGVAGLWCWITASYSVERIMLEYFFEFLSIAVSFALYAVVLLRVRGNLIHTSAGWRLRFVAKGENWKLAVTRDAMDAAVLKTATALMWYPVVYFMLLVPISITRFIEFGNHAVPLPVKIATAVIFNLTGLVDAILLFRMREVTPDEDLLPALANTKREKVDFKSGTALRITPFVAGLEGQEQTDSQEKSDQSRPSSVYSADSRRALV